MYADSYVYIHIYMDTMKRMIPSCATRVVRNSRVRSHTYTISSCVDCQTHIHARAAAQPSHHIPSHPHPHSMTKKNTKLAAKTAPKAAVIKRSPKSSNNNNSNNNSIKPGALDRFFKHVVACKYTCTSTSSRQQAITCTYSCVQLISCLCVVM